MVKALTIGVFDLLHVGHLDFLRKAAILGDLVVGIPDDDLVERLKGRRPIIPAEDRAEMLENLSFVDDVEILHDLNYAAFVKRRAPEVLVLSVGHIGKRFDQAIAAAPAAHVRIERSSRESTSAIKARICASGSQK